MATNYTSHIIPYASSNCTKRSQNWKHLRPGFNLDNQAPSPLYTEIICSLSIHHRIPPSLNTSTGGKERFLAGRRVDRVSNIQTSWQVLPDLIPEPEVVAVRVKRTSILEENHIVDKRRRGEMQASIYRFWITW